MYLKYKIDLEIKANQRNNKIHDTPPRKNKMQPIVGTHCREEISDMKRNTFVLIHPSNNPNNQNADINEDDFFEVGDKCIPLGILSIGSYLKNKGYSVELLDARFYSKESLKLKIKELESRCIAIGFSVMTGQLSHALDLSDFIKTNFSHIPVVWGGIHPTLYTEQTILDPSVDYVVSGEGEKVIEALLQNLLLQSPPPAISGLFYKLNGIIQGSQSADPIDVNEMPDFDYDLCDISKYLRVQLLNGSIVRGLGVLTSRGCPYQCSFCPVPHLNSRKWRAISPERVLTLIKKLIEKYHINYVWFMDDFLFGNKTRFEAIVRGIIDQKLCVQWSGNIRVDNISDSLVNDELLADIKKSGCYALHMGMESGDDAVLKLYKKNTSTAQIKNAVIQCHRYGIIPNGTWIMGIPHEKLSSIKKTLRFIWQLHEIDDTDPVYVPGIYRPHPGGELYQEALKLGYKEPQTLREWKTREIYVGFTSEKYLPWLEDPAMIRDFRFYGRIITAYKKLFFSKGVFKLFILLVWLAKLRFKTGFWHLRFESAFFNAMKLIVIKLCPNTYFARLLSKN
jgi:radical SAM superfamily enzyme YgiQ (UPF0313 family)